MGPTQPATAKMAGSSQVITFRRPSRSDMKFNLERGTKVRVRTDTEGLVEGRVGSNCYDSVLLELHQASLVTWDDKNKEKLTPIGFLRLDAEEVDEVVVIETKPQRIPQAVITELVHHTLTVASRNDFDRLIAKLQGVTEVAVNFYGVSVGRDGKVGWIVLFIEETLVCIDVLALQPIIKSFWQILGEKLFSNKGILKVAYSSRPMADFLHHKHTIALNNVTDLQLTEMYIRINGGHEKLTSNYRALSEMLEHYLRRIVPQLELKLLKDFEKENFSRTSPLMERPIKDRKYCKMVAISTKYLLQLKKEFFELEMLRLSSCITMQLEDLLSGRRDKVQLLQDLPLKIPDPVFKALLEIENKVQSGNQMKVKALNKDAEPDQCFFSRRGKRLIR